MARHDKMVAVNVRFQVSQAGRAKVLREKQKNIHAYVVAKEFRPYAEAIGTRQLKKITYNPYKQDCFQVDGVPIEKARMVLFENGHCWLVS